MQNITIVSTRFDENTWNQNISYRKKHGDIGCIYGSPKPISQKILIHSLLFVIEMNNTKNQIEGIGLIRNFPKINRFIYTIGNFNRYTYQGKYRLNRDELLNRNKKLVECLDYILFKEKTHMKRGSGLTTVPEKLMKHRIMEEMDVKKEICDLFRDVYKNMNKEEI
jgi:hypothetical protein